MQAFGLLKVGGGVVCELDSVLFLFVCFFGWDFFWLNLFLVLLESLILAQDERWRRA